MMSGSLTLDEALGLFLIAFDEARGTTGMAGLDRSTVNGVMLRLGAELADGTLGVWADLPDCDGLQLVPSSHWEKCFDESIDDDAGLGSMGESFLTGHLTGACFGRFQDCTPRFRQADLLGRLPALLGRASDSAAT